MKAVIAAIILAAAVACAVPEDAPTPRPTYTPYPTYTPVATATPRPTYTPRPVPVGATTHGLVAAATPRPTYTPYPTVATESGDFKVVEFGDEERFSAAAAAAIRKGREQFKNGEYYASIASFLKARSHHGKTSGVLEEWIALGYYALEQYDIAIVHHSKAIAINDNATSRVNRAFSYRDNAQCELAVVDAKAALVQEPATGAGHSTDVDANFLLAWCYYEQGYHFQALQHAETAIALMKDYQFPISAIKQMIATRDAIRQELN